MEEFLKNFWLYFRLGLLAALVAVGIIEWLKAGIILLRMPKEQRKIEGIVAWIALPFATFIGGFMMTGQLFQALGVGGVAWSIAQLCYPIVVKLPGTLISKITETKANDNADKG